MQRKRLVTVALSLLFVTSSFSLVVQFSIAYEAEPGWDFEDHTYTHADLTKLTVDQIVSQLQSSNKAFQDHGLPVPEHLAYPHGAFNSGVINVVSQHRKSGRTAGSGFSYFPETYPVQEWYTLSSACFSPAVSWTTVQGWIDLAITRKGLLNIFTHDVSETHTTYGCTPEMLAQLLDYLVVKRNAGQLSVMTIREAYNSFDGTKAVVVISFDDGYATIYTTVWPMFKARGLRGTSYISASSQDNNNPATMTWTMITEMAQPSSLTRVFISPSSVIMSVSQSQLFTSNVSGTAAPYSYQWYLDGNVIQTANGSTWTYVPSASGSHSVYLRVTDNVGIQITSNTATVEVYDQFSVTVSPISAAIGLGQSQLFTSTVLGGFLPYTYQWCLNGIAVAGATSSTWTFTPNSIGSYSVYVNVTDNSGFRAKSNVAIIAVNSIPSVTISPTAVTMSVGSSQLFTSTVSGGTSPYFYQWYLKSKPVLGATNPTWTFTPSSPGSLIVYVKVTDNAGVQVTSNTAKVRALRT